MACHGHGPIRLGLRFARNLHVRFLLVFTVSLSFAGCSTQIDCFDQGPLEAAYHSGVADAAAANAAIYDRGRTIGLNLTGADGERDGTSEGNATGHHDGFAASY